MEFHNSLLDIIGSKTKLKIVKFLINYESNMSEREISSILNVSHMSVNRIMRDLSSVNFVHCVSIGNAYLWKVNRKSYTYKRLKTFVETISKIDDPLKDLKYTIIQNLPKDSIIKVILFWSIAKGIEKTNSDIDLFILVETKQHKEKIKTALERLTILCLDKYGNVLSPYILTQIELENKNGNTLTIVATGQPGDVEIKSGNNSFWGYS